MKKKPVEEANNQRSRRNFLRNGATALAGFYILPRHVLGGPGFTAPSDKLQIAGIGAGGKGESDLWNFFQSGKADIAFLCDVDERQTKKSRQRYPKAKLYKDYREMLDKEAKHIDAVSVSTPDHMHAVQAMAAMQLNKHVYVQKPLTHDIYEARMLTQAAHRYKVVTQMGNQGSSGDGVRQLMEWYNAGLLGDVHTIYCYTDRPVWPQGIGWPSATNAIPAELDWNLWLGTAPYREYVDGLLPFNWRGWWDFGTGALGDMACHIMAPAFAVLGLGYPVSAECSVATPYIQNWTKAYHPESGPVSSSITLTFKGEKGKPDVKLHWMDGGIQPERPEELGPNEMMGDGGNGAIFIGTKGKMMCGTYGINPQLLPTSRTKETNTPQTIARVPKGDAGHYAAWVEAAIAGYGSEKAKNLSSHFDIAGPLTESVLMGNLAIRSYDIQKKDDKGKVSYPGRNIKLLWDGPNMRITNFDEANQFVKRTYRDGWSLGV
ncbi:Gfo/Idh/MocA family protein [Sediminibacterium ginsengisoli]|uniref:Oxidoreductase family, NAD-binding Rossmann fold n=1 Tax=Sediminibacterium ginsengisoli TaxID=413434 RepID=A0A1T4M2E4_9BACT|nr:Gfo/Idh/MocA family oxidoreductase [Sediminibacterium ginsengisoli]SJZ61170.1 Oxidoreductase family, NAD-binding Rossmann fold [Sediminibacterium ginsengisoli]